MTRTLIACAALGAMALPAAAQDTAASAAVSGTAEWSVRLPEGDKVPFSGVANFDAAGMGTNGMLYPAPNVGGLIVAVITHGLVSETARNGQKDKLQEEADKVLSPYESILATYSPRELMQRTLARSKIGGARSLLTTPRPSASSWIMETAPAFAMTQDQTALILQTAVAIFPPGGEAPTYQNVIKVVSPAAPAEELPGYWTANGGEKLKDESSRLLAHAMEIAVSDAGRPAPATPVPQRTFRYLQGKVEKIERAQLVSEACDRMVLRNLRGWLMSVPPRRAANTPEPCSGS